MKHLAALQIFLLNISSNMFIYIYIHVHSSRTPKIYVKTVGEKMIILKFAIQYRYIQYDIERTAHFLYFARFVFFPFAVWLKLFLFSLYVCRSYIHNENRVSTKIQIV